MLNLARLAGEHMALMEDTFPIGLDCLGEPS